MNKKTTVTKNPEFIGMDAALKRAAKAAHLLARKTKTPCYVWKDGQIVDIAGRRKTSAKSDQASDK